MDTAQSRALAAALRRRRQRLGLTQEALADLAGVGVAFLYELEKGKPTVRLDKLLAVMDLLGLEFFLREGRSLLEVDASLREEDQG